MSWEYVTLDKLGSVSRGKSKHRPRNDKTLFGGKYPFIQTADVKAAGLYLTEYTETYSDKGLAQSKLWPAGTLCITIAANIADTTILGIDACFPDSIIGFIPFEGVSNVKFVKYAFDILQRDCKKISQGTAQDNLSWEKLSTIKFPAPDIEIQNKIVSILSVYDDLIENNKKQIKLLEEAAQRLYKEWFVDFRFPGYETTEFVDGLPKGWKKLKLSDIECRLESGSRPKGGIDNNLKNGIPSIGAENVIGLGKYNFSSEKLISEEYYNRMNRGKLISKDILIYKDGANIGRTSLFQDGFPHKLASVNEHVFLLHANKDIYQYYLFFTLYQKEYFMKMQKLNKNSAQPGINSNSMLSLDLLLPSIEIIEKFDLKVTPFVKEIFTKAKQNINLTEARDRLLPKLMSGEIEISPFSKGNGYDSSQGDFREV